jgi:DNA-binding MarR family transcriptional regulator
MSTNSRSGTDLGMLLAACCERLVRRLFDRLAGAGYGHLTPSQAVTVLLVGDGIDTVTQIAERIGMTTQAMSKICTALYAEGLLDRQPHAKDARSRRLALTANGERVLALMRAAGNDAERAWAELVGAEALDTVRSALAAYAHAPEPAILATPVRIRFA